MSAPGPQAFFFFQAEDGIRDYKVTGVQTCALPIYGSRRCRCGARNSCGDGQVAAARGEETLVGSDEMKNDCAKWKEKLLEAALTGTAAGELGPHLSSCAGCMKELEALRARRERLGALRPSVARSAERPGECGQHGLAAAQAAG